MKEGKILKNAVCKMQIAKCVNERGNDFDKCKWQNADCRLQMVKVGSHIYKVQIADCKMQNARLSRGRGGGQPCNQGRKVVEAFGRCGQGEGRIRQNADFEGPCRFLGHGQIADCRL